MGQHMSRGWWLGLAASLLGCSAGSNGDSVEDQGSVSSALTQTTGTTRYIGVDFFMMGSSATPNPVTNADINKAIDTANSLFAPMNLVFYTNTASWVTMQYLHDVSSTTSRTWSQIANDASNLGIASNSFPTANATTPPLWLGQLSKLRPPTRVTVLVALSGLGGSNCASPSPHDDGYNWNNYHPSGPGWTNDHSHGIVCVRDSNGINALAHELGHYFELLHTFDVTNAGVLAITGQTAADYYDLVYRPNGAGVTTYTSKAAVGTAPGLLLKDDGSARSLNNVVACSDPAWNPNPCEHGLTFTTGTGSRVEYRTSSNPTQMAGMTAAPTTPGGQYRINAMSYWCPKCPMFFSDSQREIMAGALESMKGQRQMLGQNVLFGPAVSSWGADRLDVLWHNANDQLAIKTYANGWGSMTVIPTTELGSDPAVVSWGVNRRDVFWRGIDNHLKHIANGGTGTGGWTGEEDLGGDMRSSPAVASWGSGRLDVFWRGSDSHLKHIWYPYNNGWSWEEDLGGSLASDPSAVSWGNGRLDVFWRGTDSKLKHKWFPDYGNWSGEQDMGNWIGSAPTVASWGSGRLDVFWRGSTGTVKHRWFPYNGDWSFEEDLGGFLDSDPSAVSWASGRLDVFWAGAGKLRHKWYPYNNAWSGEEDLGSLQVTY